MLLAKAYGDGDLNIGETHVVRNASVQKLMIDIIKTLNGAVLVGR